ncbi:MAG: methyl-accepting chemotaxis protein, partial [Planctomycetota bacterium]
MLTFSENRMVVDAMRDFPEQFDAYVEQAEVEDIPALRRELATYYEGEFSAEYRSQNGESPNADRFLSELDDDSVALQHAYIRANRNPLGSKHELDTADETTDYGKLHKLVHPVVRSYLDKFGYYDIFLVDSNTGDIVYSVFKELDYSTSLIDGPYADTNFGEAFRKANQMRAGEFALVDFEPYTPSYEAPASFIASPIYDGDEKLGVAIFQMPVDRIIGVMAHREGMGETGEAILIGSDHLMRCDSFLEPETHGLVNSFRNPDQGRVDSEDVTKALAGESGVMTTVDYRGEETAVAYGPVDLLGTRWAMLVKMDTSEAFAAAEKMEANAAAAAATVLGLNVGITVLATIGVLLVAWFVTRALIKPITQMIERAQDIAEGDADLTQRLDASANDELGELAEWFNRFIERVQSIIGQLGQSSSSLAEASGRLSQAGQSLATGAEDTTMKSATVAAAAEEMSANMGQVATSTASMSENIRSVAAATDQMTSTINEIARNAEQSATVADQAARLAETSNEKVGSLGDAANEIGKVIEVIQDIAEQTNLLALNATIEAARAGEAGKGFAVVATEVKELAKQTATATDDIRQRIEGIQGSTGEAVDAIRDITSVINNVNEVARTIASAVEEQSITTQEIAENVAQSASTADAVAQGVSESAAASQEITQNITGVDMGAKKTSEAAGETESAGSAVSQLAGDMQTLVSQFKI